MSFDLHTVVGDYINIMKTTFDLNYNLYPACNKNEYTKTWKKEKMSRKKASL